VAHFGEISAMISTFSGKGRVVTDDLASLPIAPVHLSPAHATAGRTADAHEPTWRFGHEKEASGTLDEAPAAGAVSPANQVRFSRFRGTFQQGPVQRQETQIVQPCKTLGDFLRAPWKGVPS